MDTSLFNTLNFEDILLNNDLAKFGDSIVNFIYNAAIFAANSKLQGVKVWDICLANACKNSPLRTYIGSKKNKGELGDVVEAFIGYVYLTQKFSIIRLIDILTKYIKHEKFQSNEKDQEICSAAFTHLVNQLCKKLSIEDKAR